MIKHFLKANIWNSLNFVTWKLVSKRRKTTFTHSYVKVSVVFRTFYISTTIREFLVALTPAKCNWFSVQNGETAVHLAAKNGHAEVLKRLLLCGVEVDDRDVVRPRGRGRCRGRGGWGMGVRMVVQNLWVTYIEWPDLTVDSGYIKVCIQHAPTTYYVTMPRCNTICLESSDDW